MTPARAILVVVLLANLVLAAALMLSDRPIRDAAPTPLQAGENPLQLLTEMPAPVPEVSRECRIVARESEQESLAALIAGLADRGGQPEVRQVRLPRDPDFLVFVRSLESPAEADHVARKLREQGIESFAMSDDDGYPIVSVGMFSRHNLARRQLDNVKKIGYDVFMQTIERSAAMYELTAQIGPEDPLYDSSISPCQAIAQRN